MNTNAAGQLHGYIYQIPRALYHLLKSSPGDSICVEVVGDVSIKKANSQIFTEEDKSSINSNPVTDRSINLWKTFHNWIQMCNNEKLEIDNTTFILSSNIPGRKAIINSFHGAKTEEQAKISIADAIKKLADIQKGHEIFEYFDFVVNKNKETMIKIIQKFEFVITDKTGFKEIEKELIRRSISEGYIPDLIERMIGWLQETISSMITNRQQVIISWEEFDRKFRTMFERIHRLELIDFTIHNPIKESDIKQQIKTKKIYIQQLDLIDLDPDEIIEAVTHFLRAKVNRDKWIENGIIDEEIALDFEQKLKAYWRNKKTEINITNKNIQLEEKGKLLLAQCSNHQIPIRGESPPDATIAGTYHALADEPSIGWHPNWEHNISNSKGK